MAARTETDARIASSVDFSIHRPQCSRCLALDLACTRAPDIRFKHAVLVGSNHSRHDFEFAEDQVWLPTAGQLIFVGEARGLALPPDLGHSDPDASPAGILPGATGDANTDDSDLEQEASQEIASSLDANFATGNAEIAAIEVGGGEAAILENDHFDIVPSFKAADHASRTSSWPLKSREEADLFRFFVERIAPWFDLTDQARHFQLVVPRHAATCPPLLNAIFALAAGYLSRVEDFDLQVSDGYYDRCLASLIPRLSDPEASMDEDLLASTVILRHLEEIQVPLSGHVSSAASPESHLFGSHAFLDAQNFGHSDSSMRSAAFWVAIRQDIYVALVNQREVAIHPRDCGIDSSSSPTTDYEWSRKMVIVCAEVIDCCFGKGQHDPSEFARLSDELDTWDLSKPASFEPIYFQARDDSVAFPTIFFLNTAVCLGWQHFHLANILLQACSPQLPRLGSVRRMAESTVDESIRDHVRVLCGICTSSPELLPNHRYASVAITLAGDRFTEAQDQEALLGILRKCHDRYAFPTQQAQQDLEQAWQVSG